MNINDRDSDARGHFHAARGRERHGAGNRIQSALRRSDELRGVVTNMARIIGERREFEQQRRPQAGRSYLHVEKEIYQALGPVLGANWQAELKDAMYTQLFGLSPDDNDDDGDDGAAEQDDAHPMDNPSADVPDPRAEMEQTVAALRADPLIHRPEERNNPILDRRLPGSTDAAFKPNQGDIILRITPGADGNELEYSTGGSTRAASVQAGDKVVRLFYDNLSEKGFTVTYAELHLCVGNEGSPELPEFLYFGRAVQKIAHV